MTDSVSSAVQAVEDRRWAAQIEGDADSLAALLADELTYTHSNGVVDSRDSYLEKVAEGFFDYRSEVRSDTAVTTIGDCAIVTGRVEFEVVVGGSRQVRLDSRYSTVLVQRDGRWLVVCYQSTPIAS